MKKQTLAVHGGEKENSFFGAVNVPIFQSSTYMLNKGAGYHDVKYMRLSNSPNHLQVHSKLAQLESAEAAVVTASGMAAISTALLSGLRSGDHMLAQASLYGGTHDLLHEDLRDCGISSTLVSTEDPSEWERALTPATKVFYVEALSNPLLQIGRLDEVVQFCRKRGLVSVIDGTFTTPAMFRPLEMGFDLVVHSATKALNGHSDVIAGVVAGSGEKMKAVLRKLNHLGGFLDVHAIYLLNRGLKTLFVRVERQSENALALAEFLESHARVKRVIYPGLKSHPEHARAKTWFSGFGTMLSFELKGEVEEADRLISRLKLFMEAPSLGGVESLITRPATSSHSGMSPEDRRKAGITEGLIRMSVGLESAEDLINDLDQAFR
jgi:cystathionine beta-lyase/cystathionine gamma-synthase